eukprot:GHVO01017679.1.p1 GENE.GHVO01017679.1~~GHVO01017679.1.p1  ORF type:complete len:344 (-),score=39.91 GHVO01017679.1:107-1138(-)
MRPYSNTNADRKRYPSQDSERRTAKYTLIVNVPALTTRNAVLDAFRPYGDIIISTIVCLSENRHPTKEWTATAGYGFVRFRDHQEAERAFRASRSGLITVGTAKVKASWAKQDSFPTRAQLNSMKPSVSSPVLMALPPVEQVKGINGDNSDGSPNGEMLNTKKWNGSSRSKRKHRRGNAHAAGTAIEQSSKDGALPCKDAVTIHSTRGPPPCIPPPSHQDDPIPDYPISHHMSPFLSGSLFEPPLVDEMAFDGPMWYESDSMLTGSFDHMDSLDLTNPAADPYPLSCPNDPSFADADWASIIESIRCVSDTDSRLLPSMLADHMPDPHRSEKDPLLWNIIEPE